MATLEGLTLGTVTKEAFFKKSGLIVAGLPLSDSDDAFIEDLGGNVLTLELYGNLTADTQVTQMLDLLGLISGSQPTASTYSSDKFGSIDVKLQDMRFTANSVNPMAISYTIKTVVDGTIAGP